MQRRAVMLFISTSGLVDAERVKVAIQPEIERNSMDRINGIVVHQTGGSTAGSTFSSYQKKGANGAHFLIDKDGTIYQTASLIRKTNHVGLLRSRCLETRNCAPVEIAEAMAYARGARTLHKYETKKKWPDRFPSNDDSVGIELVGTYTGPEGKEVYENVTDRQNLSLKWLIMELSDTFGLLAAEVYRHPDVSYKNETEASTAKW